MALKHNLITFTTIDTMRKRACHFETLMDMHIELCRHLLEKLALEEFGGQMPASLRETLSRHCPDYIRDGLDKLFGDTNLQDKMWYAAYIAPSARFAFPKFIMQQPECAPFFARLPKAFLDLDLHNQPWRIPLEEENADALQLLTPMMIFGDNPEVIPYIPRFFERPTVCYAAFRPQSLPSNSSMV